MKKLTLVSVISMAMMSGSAFAVDPVQVVQFNGVITSDVVGDTSIITGVNGGAVSDGEINVSTDGTFVTTKPVTLELYDPTGITPMVGDWSISQVDYRIGGVGVTTATITVTDLTSGNNMATSTNLALTQGINPTQVGSVSISATGTTTDQAEVDNIVTPGGSTSAGLYITVVAQNAV
ncbi:hypothetical protein KDD30_17505 (plasmid) [Photobacterium sp. GJ3]|uniref:hypothetical protein n=1 Tax=Photobacterium sp. GJ3 TaxID=2829502 RepID=UPI001B8CD356|nr:hypothetical protein [Photobacterium sp. GJ3]QUJ69955.1 hypothetical protein KDD30_17505 [Photobacterium sp. GJ3]